MQRRTSRGWSTDESRSSVRCGARAHRRLRLDVVECGGRRRSRSLEDVVRGNEECMYENSNCEKDGGGGRGGGFTGHCQIEYLLTWRAAGLEVIVGVCVGD